MPFLGSLGKIKESQHDRRRAIQQHSSTALASEEAEIWTRRALECRVVSSWVKTSQSVPRAAWASAKNSSTAAVRSGLRASASCYIVKACLCIRVLGWNPNSVHHERQLPRIRFGLEGAGGFISTSSLG